MGIISSTGKNNDELVDNLIESNYIRYKSVEWVMRLVDRGDFYPLNEKEMAYKDMAWKESEPVAGPIHLSAPCIYANALEYLDLQPGMSFLNIGSGTGYLNTLAGFLLTESGINHGVELYENLVEYALSCLSESLKRPSTSAFSFCIPEFFTGSAFFIRNQMQYDRIYCGALVPSFRRSYFGRMLKINGILVMPYGSELVRVVRTDENAYTIYTVSQVSFSHLLTPSEDRVFTNQQVTLPFNQPKSLQEMCRLSLRSTIRSKVHKEKPLEIHFECGPIPQPDTERRMEGGGMGAVLVIEPRNEENETPNEEPEHQAEENPEPEPMNEQGDAHEPQEGMIEAQPPENHHDQQDEDEDPDEDANLEEVIDRDVRELNQRVEQQVNETMELFENIRRRHMHLQQTLGRNRGHNRRIVVVQNERPGDNRAPNQFEDENGWQGNHIGQIRIVLADLDEDILNINIGEENENQPQAAARNNNPNNTNNNMGLAMHDEELHSEFNPLVVPPQLEHVMMSDLLPQYLLKYLNQPSTSESTQKKKKVLLRRFEDRNTRALRVNRLMNGFRLANRRQQGRNLPDIEALMLRVRNRMHRRNPQEPVSLEGSARTRPNHRNDELEEEMHEDQPTSTSQLSNENTNASTSEENSNESSRKRSAPQSFDDPNESQVKRSNSDDNLPGTSTSTAPPEPQSAMSSPGVGVYEGSTESREESSETDTSKDSEAEKAEKDERLKIERANRAKAQLESMSKFHEMFQRLINELPVSERLIRFLRYEN